MQGWERPIYTGHEVRIANWIKDRFEFLNIGITLRLIFRNGRKQKIGSELTDFGFWWKQTQRPSNRCAEIVNAFDINAVILYRSVASLRVYNLTRAMTCLRCQIVPLIKNYLNLLKKESGWDEDGETPGEGGKWFSSFFLTASNIFFENAKIEWYHYWSDGCSQKFIL